MQQCTKVSDIKDEVIDTKLFISERTVFVESL